MTVDTKQNENLSESRGHWPNVNFRLSPEIIKELDRVSTKIGMHRSEFCRHAVRASIEAFSEREPR